MGNQSFFSPKNKTRTWAFLHAHLYLNQSGHKFLWPTFWGWVTWWVCKNSIQFNILKLLLITLDFKT